jgi:tetratricopeptide (TPR) repeat protein
MDSQSGLPPALTALDSYPLLQASVEPSLAQQAACVVERTATFQQRRALLAELGGLFHSIDSGLIALEGPPGSGVTTLLAHLAATRPCAFWFCDEDGGQGAAALCAQLIALHNLRLPLIPPAAHSNPEALAQVLDELSAHHTTSEPAIILFDHPDGEQQPQKPFPINLPSHLPPHVLLVYGCTPDTPLPCAPRARLSLPLTDDETRSAQQHALHAMKCPENWHEAIISAAEGNFFYLRLACNGIQQHWLDSQSLKPGLDSLYDAWWAALDTQNQQLALLLAACGEPLPLDLCAKLYGADPTPVLQQWTSLVTTRKDAISFYHWSTKEYMARSHGSLLQHMHAELATVALNLEHVTGLSVPVPEQATPSVLPLPSTLSSRGITYFSNQFARHAALGNPFANHRLLPLVTQRAWIRTRERHSNNLMGVANDVAWELRTVTQMPTHDTTTIPDVMVRMGYSVALLGTFNLSARTLSPDAAVSALEVAFNRIGRESGLKRVLEIVDQLPDGRTKAQVLRQLGDACYAASMRNSAMRLLSQALDLEEQRMPASWREHHDRLMGSMVDTALALEDVDEAFAISECIFHREQRGMAETHIVRFLVEHGELVRARKIATSITHENLRSWAQAEVVVAFARQDDMYMADMLLNDIHLDTPRAWAHTELACLAVTHTEDAAYHRIAQLPHPNQREHGMARLSIALAQANKEHNALKVIRSIDDPALRVSALLDLRPVLDHHWAMIALKEASDIIGELSRDIRIPLLAMLAASYAAIGQGDMALDITLHLDAGEERERGISRVAVALAHYGNHAEGVALAKSLEDDDERDWTLGELAHVLAEAGHWQEAQSLGHQISDERDRASTLAHLSVALARTGATLAALWLTRSIAVPAERSRALIMIAPLLVHAGYGTEALEAFQVERRAIEQKTEGYLEPLQLDRYLTALTIALIEHGNLARASTILNDIVHTFDRARVYLAMARQTAPHDPSHACSALGKALCLATRDRGETFRLLEHAAPVLAQTGGASLVTRLAHAINNFETW